VAAFLNLLTGKSIQVVVDVRSAPYSRYVPQFNKRNIQSAIQNAGLKYVFMGDEIGGKPSDPGYCDANRKALYCRIAESEKFRQGLDRLKIGLADGWKIALMCAEEDPGKCHRHQLIAKESSPAYRQRADVTAYYGPTYSRGWLITSGRGSSEKRYYSIPSANFHPLKSRHGGPLPALNPAIHRLCPLSNK